MSLYTDIRAELKTGDLVLFVGKGAWADFIKRMSGPYCHVAMIVEDMTGGLGVWESTKNKRSGGIWGVQWSPLSARLAEEAAPVYVRRTSRVMSPVELGLLWNARQEFDGTPYEKMYLSLLVAAQAGAGWAHEATDSVFCSELIAAVYHRLGWLDKAAGPSSGYTPTDFSTKTRTPLALIGVELGDEIQIA